MSDIEQAVNKYTAQVIEYTLDAVKKTIDLYTDKNGMVKATALKGALGTVFHNKVKGDNDK
jgi:hypothetical protein